MLLSSCIHKHTIEIQQNGWTPLHAACQSNDSDILRILIENGAEVDAKNQVN